MTTPNDLPEYIYGGETSEFEKVWDERTVRHLVSERDELASRVAELEAEVLDQCRLNGMGAERESALMGRVRELEGALKECAAVCAGETMSKQGLINALEKARAALNASKEQP